MRTLWRIAAAVLGLIAVFLASAPTRHHVALIAHALRGDQQWDQEASRRILSALVMSQLSGGDESRWWLHSLDGLSRLPFDSVKDRHDSLVRLASNIPERSSEWLPGPGEVGNAYERFLRALVSEEQKHADLSAAEAKAFATYQQMSFARPRDHLSHAPSDSREYRSAELILRLLRRSENPGEAAKALLAFLPFKQFPGGLREASYSEPPYDEEIDYEKLGTLVFAHRTAECDGLLQRLGGSEQSAEPVHIQVLVEVREYTLKRPWLNEALLEAHRTRAMPGERFFGKGGSLHLLPTHVLITIGPRYVAALTPQNERRLRPWITQGECCEVLCNGTKARLNASRVFIDHQRLAGLDSVVRVDSFALISRVY